MPGDFFCLARFFVLEDYLWKNSGMTCMFCEKGILHSLYIPPTKSKNYNPLKDSWMDARLFLNNADVLIIIGYSMPYYDLQAKMLQKELKEGIPVYVIDKYASRVVKNYSFLRGNPKYFYSCTFREFMWELASNDGFPENKFVYFE